MYPANDVHNRVKYQGHWKSSQKEGHGKLRFKDGGECVGDFKHDQCHGQGTVTKLSDDQLDFYNEHWTNLHDRASIDHIQDLHEIVSHHIHHEHEGHIIGTQHPLDY